GLARQPAIPSAPTSTRTRPISTATSAGRRRSGLTPTPTNSASTTCTATYGNGVTASSHPINPTPKIRNRLPVPCAAAPSSTTAPPAALPPAARIAVIGATALPDSGLPCRSAPRLGSSLTARVGPSHLAIQHPVDRPPLPAVLPFEVRAPLLPRRFQPRFLDQRRLPGHRL